MTFFCYEFSLNITLLITIIQKASFTSWISSGTEESISLKRRFLSGLACRPKILVATPPARASARWLDRSRRHSLRKLWCSLQINNNNLIQNLARLHSDWSHMISLSARKTTEQVRRVYNSSDGWWLTHSPGWGERKRRDLAVDAFTVSFKEGAQMRECAFF